MSRKFWPMPLMAALVLGVGACSKDDEPTNAQTPADGQASANVQSLSSAQPGSRAPGPKSGPPGAQAGNTMMQQMRASCPMVVADTNVEASDTEDGVALTFTTTSDSVADLRQRVEQMAQMYEQRHGEGRMMWHHMGPGRGMGMGMGHGKGMGPGSGPMPAASVKVENTNDGARMILTPKSPSELEALREHANWHAQRMQGRECWMSQGS